MPDRARSLAASLVLVPWACFCVIGTAAAEVVPATSPASTEYAVKLAEYEAAQARFQDEARAYWNLVGEKRRGRIVKRQAGTPLQADDYVLTQPPVYAGPPKPRNPAVPPGEEERPSRPQIPVVADFVRHAQEQYGFSPDRPLHEDGFKRAYAVAAKRAGLTRDQIVRVYGFESGGDGKYDVQAGLEHPGPDSRAISTALGYNQLLSTNSVELLAESGDRFLDILRGKVSTLPADAAERLTNKITILERMRAFSLSVPDDWSAHERIAAEPQGLGIHALNLDVDVGPLLQTQKLLELGDVCESEEIFRKPDSRGIGDDESDGGRKRSRHDFAAEGPARSDTNLQFLPAKRLRAQSRGKQKSDRGKTDRRNQRRDGSRVKASGRQNPVLAVSGRGHAKAPQVVRGQSSRPPRSRRRGRSNPARCGLRHPALRSSRDD